MKKKLPHTPPALQLPLFVVLNELDTPTRTAPGELPVQNRMRVAVGGWEDWLDKTLEEVVSHWYTLYADFVQVFDEKIAQNRQKQREAVDGSQKAFYKQLINQQQQQRDLIYGPLSSSFGDEMTKVVHYAQAYLLQTGIPEQEIDCMEETISELFQRGG